AAADHGCSAGRLNNLERTAMSLAAAVKDLAQTFTGRLLQGGEAGYDEARRVHNGLVDKRPALVARCHGMADVADAVKLARAQGLEVSVCGGGNNVAGCVFV